jgi:hypothetical protein
MSYIKLYSDFMAGYTSIQLLPITRKRLAELKTARETYDDLLNKLLKLIPAGDDEGEFTNEFRIGLLNARLDVLRGRTIPHSEVKKRLGL